MKTIITLALGVFFICYGCNDIPEGYQKFQTFNEYSLKGIGLSNYHLRKPYIAAKFGKEKITVLIFEKNGEVRQIEYFNKGNYWYTKYKLQLKFDPNCRCDTTPAFFEKYIYKDTIMLYHHAYNRDNKKLKMETLYFITKNNFILISDSCPLKIDSTNIFKSLKNKYLYFQNQLTHNSYIDGNHPLAYSYYSKVFRGDTIFRYERNEKNKKILSSDYMVVDNLGEYGVLIDWGIQ